MTRKKDAGELLYYFYNSQLINQTISAEKLLKETSWGSWRLEKAIKYLIEIDTIKITLFKEKIERLQKFVVAGLTREGTQLIEEKDKFKATFGFERDLDSKRYSWNIKK